MHFLHEIEVHTYQSYQHSSWSLVLAKIHPAQWATLHNLASWSRHMQWSYIPFTINLVTGMALSVQTLLLDKAAGYAWKIWSGDETIGQVETYNCTHTHVAYLFSVYISRFPASRWSCCHGRGCWSWGHRWEGGGGGGSRGGRLGVSYKFLILSQGRGRWGHGTHGKSLRRCSTDVHTVEIETRARKNGQLE